MFQMSIYTYGSLFGIFRLPQTIYIYIYIFEKSNEEDGIRKPKFSGRVFEKRYTWWTYGVCASMKWSQRNHCFPFLVHEYETNNAEGKKEQKKNRGEKYHPGKKKKEKRDRDRERRKSWYFQQKRGKWMKRNVHSTSSSSFEGSDKLRGSAFSKGERISGEKRHAGEELLVRSGEVAVSWEDDVSLTFWKTSRIDILSGRSLDRRLSSWWIPRTRSVNSTTI